MMKLTIVGCSGSLSGPDSAASSYLVQAPYQDRTFSLLTRLRSRRHGCALPLP